MTTKAVTAMQGTRVREGGEPRRRARSNDGPIVEALGGREVLGPNAGADEGMVSAIRGGLDIGAFDALVAHLDVSRERLAKIVGIPPRTLARRKASGVLGPIESDRTFRVARIFARAADVLGSREKAARWLVTPNRALGQEAPLDRLDTDLGSENVDDVLGRIEHGVFG